MTSIATATASLAKKFFSIKELSQILGMSKSTLYECVYRKKIPAKRLGKRILIPVGYVERELLNFN